MDGGTGNGGGLSHLVGNLAGSVNSLFERMKTLTGLDVVTLMEEHYNSSPKEKNLV